VGPGDLDEEYDRKKNGGVDVLADGKDLGGGGRFCCFKDPDGTILELIDFGGGRR